jgi:hypothetical protein
VIRMNELIDLGVIQVGAKEAFAAPLLAPSDTLRRLDFAVSCVRGITFFRGKTYSNARPVSAVGPNHGHLEVS